MTTKPIAVWCVVNELGQPLEYYFRVTRSRSIAAFCAPAIGYYGRNKWKMAYRGGYRCKRFILSEGEGHEQ